MTQKTLSGISRYSASRYDEFYATPQARRENTEIEKLFQSEFDPGLQWLDIGCGTGFGLSIMPLNARYLGVDIDPDMIYACKQKHSKGVFLNETAESQDLTRNVISIFSLNYLSLQAVRRLAHESARAFAVIYNKPFLKGSASAYQGKASEFFVQHGIKPQLIRYMLESSGFKVFSLLGQSYYHVGVKNGRAADRAAVQPGVLQDAGVAA